MCCCCFADDYYGGYETLAIFTDDNGDVDFESAYNFANGLGGFRWVVVVPCACVCVWGGGRGGRALRKQLPALQQS